MRTYRPYTSSIIVMLLNVFFIILAFNNESFILYFSIAMILILYMLSFTIVFKYISFDEDFFKTNFRQKIELLDCEQDSGSKRLFRYTNIANVTYEEPHSMLANKLLVTITLKDGRKYILDLSLLNKNQQLDIKTHFKQNI